MITERCKTCTGYGEIMGGGMMMKKCHECSGTGKIILPDDDIEYLIAKESESYKEIKKKISDAHNDLSESEIEIILDQELENSKPRKVEDD
jgi:RecJ-like exonuclease